MTTKTIDLWVDHKLEIPNLWSKNGISITKTVRWDKDTELTKAELITSVKSDKFFVSTYIDLNGEGVQSFSWGINETGLKTDRVNIIGNLINGDNKFGFLASKDIPSAMWVTFIVTVRLVLTYEGEEPVEEPSYMGTVKIIAAATIGITAGVATASVILKKKGEKK